jgi:hypothetical protein
MSGFCDRILGVSRQVEAPAYTVMALTGNNVLPKGALASRTLLDLEQDHKMMI